MYGESTTGKAGFYGLQQKYFGDRRVVPVIDVPWLFSVSTPYKNPIAPGMGFGPCYYATTITATKTSRS